MSKDKKYKTKNKIHNKENSQFNLFARKEISKIKHAHKNGSLVFNSDVVAGEILKEHKVGLTKA